MPLTKRKASMSGRDSDQLSGGYILGEIFVGVKFPKKNHKKYRCFKACITDHFNH